MLLLVLGIGVYGEYRWQQFKREHGIVAFELNGVHLSAGGIAVRRIVLIREQIADERLRLSIDGLQILLDTWWRPLPPEALRIDHLQADWQHASEANENLEEEESLALPDRQQLERWAAWIPRSGHIASLSLSLPCASGTCREVGELKWRHAGEQALPIEATINLRRNAHRLALQLHAHETDATTHVDLELQLDDEPRLTMQNQLIADAGATLWHGTLAMSELPEAPWLLEWLGEWLDYEPPPLPGLPEQMRLGAGWALRIDSLDLMGGWQTLDGELRLSANIPAPWPVAGLGQLQGRLDLSAKADQGAWVPTDLAADMQLQPAATLFATLPAQLRPSGISVQITPGVRREAAATLPLKVMLATRGSSALTLDSEVVLETTAPYTLAFEQARVRLQSPALAVPNLAIKGLNAELRLSGHADQDAAFVRLGEGSRVSLDSLASGTEITAEKLQMDLPGIEMKTDLVEWDMQQLLLDGQVAIQVAQLRQPSLRPQGWHWKGKLNADRERLTLDGPLGNDVGLTLPLTLERSWSNGTMQLSAKLPELFLRAGNPFAATLADWPQVLELNTGRLQGQARLDLPASGPLAATATLAAKGIGGIYDRTELGGLDANLSLTLARNQLRLDIPDLTLQQVNPGFTFGPLRFNGEYAAPLDHLVHGRLAWSTAEIHMLGGRLWLDPGAVDLAANKQQLTAHLRGLRLPLLLEAYPAEGLSGTGTIDGELQLQRSEAGMSIERGSLKAREPGGTLQFRSAKIQALGQSNPAMRLVTEALDDFHYDLLTSDVQYSTDGKLNLGLKLHGRNPALKGGRPINFAINLEEDIPALLTSLQLSDRVSETIQRRVQERLR